MGWISMRFKDFWAQYGVDVIVVGASALLSSAFAIYLAIPKEASSSIAVVKRDASEIARYDLSKESLTPREVVIQGLYSEMTLGLKKNAIAVLASGCHSHYCIYQGYISEANHPIICAYNHVSITILGVAEYDVTI